MLRTRLKEEWTGERTVAAWRKWHAQIAAFTRGATEAILEAAQLRPGMRVLDLACGVGDPALSIAAQVGLSGRVTATDFGPGMMSLAEELARKKGLANIDFREANAESLPFADASFDILTCRFGIMFFPDLGKALRECLRVLKPGGRPLSSPGEKRSNPSSPPPRASFSTRSRSAAPAGPRWSQPVYVRRTRPPPPRARVRRIRQRP